jgi:hypothetical protein
MHRMPASQKQYPINMRRADDAADPPSGHATIAVLRAVAAVAKRRADFAGRQACPHR